MLSPLSAWASHLRHHLSAGAIFGQHRWLHATSPACVGRTWESKPVPGSQEDKDPQGWAKRLFELQQLDKAKPQTAADEPAKVLMVRRVMPWRESTYYEKCMLYKLGISKDTPRVREWLPLPNVPSVADDLRKVQHLLQILPLSMPDGVPSSESDLDNCYVTESGELRMRRKTGAATEVQPGRHAEAAAQLAPRRVHSMGLYHEKRWRASVLFSEYYTTRYRYEHMQDGNPYRYSGLWRRDKAMQQSLARRTNPDGTKRPNLTFEADHGSFPWRNY